MDAPLPELSMLECGQLTARKFSQKVEVVRALREVLDPLLVVPVYGMLLN